MDLGIVIGVVAFVIFFVVLAVVSLRQARVVFARAREREAPSVTVRRLAPWWVLFVTGAGVAIWGDTVGSPVLVGLGFMAVLPAFVVVCVIVARVTRPPDGRGE